MLLHQHATEDGNHFVVHFTREETVELAANLTQALENNPETTNFSINLGVPSDYVAEEAPTPAPFAAPPAPDLQIPVEKGE